MDGYALQEVKKYSPTNSDATNQPEKLLPKEEVEEEIEADEVVHAEGLTDVPEIKPDKEDVPSPPSSCVSYQTGISKHSKWGSEKVCVAKDDDEKVVFEQNNVDVKNNGEIMDVKNHETVIENEPTVVPEETLNTVNSEFTLESNGNSILK